jgi:integrase/recombinase XerD
MDEIKLHQFAEKLELLGYSKRVVADYPASLRQFFRYLADHESVDTIAFGKTKRGEYLSSGTVCARLLAVRSFFRIMHDERLIDRDLATAVTMPKHRAPLPSRVPGEKELQTLLDSIAPNSSITTRDRAMLELLYATGLRNEELRGLTLDNLDIAEKTMFVHGKGSKDRIVLVGGWVMPHLLKYLESARPLLHSSRNPTDLIFVSKNSRRITNCNLNDLIRKYARRAGLEHRITPHSFRHACATHLLKAGADIRYVQELLGHADLSSTQIYTRLDITFLKAAHRKYHPREKTDG